MLICASIVWHFIYREDILCQEAEWEYACTRFHKSVTDGDSWSFHTVAHSPRKCACQADDDCKCCRAEGHYVWNVLPRVFNNLYSHAHTWGVKRCWQAKHCEVMMSPRWSDNSSCKLSRPSFDGLERWCVSKLLMIQKCKNNCAVMRNSMRIRSLERKKGVSLTFRWSI